MVLGRDLDSIMINAKYTAPKFLEGIFYDEKRNIKGVLIEDKYIIENAIKQSAYSPEQSIIFLKELIKVVDKQILKFQENLEETLLSLQSENSNRFHELLEGQKNRQSYYIERYKDAKKNINEIIFSFYLGHPNLDTQRLLLWDLHLKSQEETRSEKTTNAISASKNPEISDSLRKKKFRYEEGKLRCGNIAFLARVLNDILEENPELLNKYTNSGFRIKVGELICEDTKQIQNLRSDTTGGRIGEDRKEAVIFIKDYLKKHNII